MARRGTRGLASIPFSRLTAEIARRERELPRLRRRHARLLAEARTVATQIESLGGEPGAGSARGRRRVPGRRRLGNKQTLTQALAALLRGKTMRVIEAADAVRKAGYRTASRHFNTQVGLALTKGPFRRVGRGRYTSRGA